MFDVVTEMPLEVTDFTIDGECSNCGACCSNYLPLSREDIDRISRYIKKHNIKPSAHGIPYNAGVDMICPFMVADKEHKCRIYHVRPKICRLFYCNKKVTMEDARELWDCMPVNVRKTFF